MVKVYDGGCYTPFVNPIQKKAEPIVYRYSRVIWYNPKQWITRSTLYIEPEHTPSIFGTYAIKKEHITSIVNWCKRMTRGSFWLTATDNDYRVIPMSLEFSLKSDAAMFKLMHNHMLVGPK